MNIPVVWQSYYPETPNRGYWDQAMLEALFRNELWKPASGFSFVSYDDLADVPEDAEGAVVILPARYHVNDVSRINADLQHFRWVLLVIGGEEEGMFPLRQLGHTRIKVWLMSPHVEKDANADRYIGVGYPTDARRFLSISSPDLTRDRPNHWFFAGQVTHDRREQCVRNLRDLKEGVLVETPGFTLGLDHETYYREMVSSRVIPCPSGPETPDTFRFYEALEAGCVPVADDLTPAATGAMHYWARLFGQKDLPFPVIDDNWESLPGWIDNIASHYPAQNNRVYAWWQMYKRSLAYGLMDDLIYLTGDTPESQNPNDRITVLIPTSPIAAHPSTHVISETIGTIRARLPDAEILIMVDGVREEQKHYTDRYQEYTRELLWKCNFEWTNVVPIVFAEHQHQANMTRETLRRVRTPLIMFVEHDTPICEDIPFDGICDIVQKGDAHLVRLHHEALILDVHQHLMLDSEPIIVHGVPIVRTRQWSQRPHVASADWYRRILDENFGPNSRTMIEDLMHSVVDSAVKDRARSGWNDYKVVIYTPPGGDIKRSYHLDGRGDDEKFDMDYGT